MKKIILIILCFTLFSCSNMIIEIGNTKSSESGQNEKNQTQSNNDNNNNNNSQINEIQYLVTYSSEYGSTPSAFIVTKGTIITKNMLPVLTYPGKSFEGWYINEKKVFANNFTIESNICLTAKWLPGLPTYLVRHWKESLNNSQNDFYIAEEELKEGPVNSITQAQLKEYYGFNAISLTQELIQEDSTTIINIYYIRKTYTINLDLQGGNGQTKITGKYESLINYPNPTKENFIFYGWNTPGGKLPSKITKNDNYTALWTDQGNYLEIDINNNLQLTITSLQEDNKLIISTEEGYSNYIWKIDSRPINNTTEIVMPQEPNKLIITNFAQRESGVYAIQVTAIKNTLEYSGLLFYTKN